MCVRERARKGERENHDYGIKDEPPPSEARTTQDLNDFELKSKIMIWL